jgi:hypothetical protein
MSTPRATIIATQKNEGLFLVEWIAHHLGVGFDAIVLATNDCEDGSVALIQAIARHFPVQHIDNSQKLQGMTIRSSATTRCLESPVARKSDWIMHIDLDEFVNYPSEKTNIKRFLERFDHADAIALIWRMFGDAQRAHWDGGHVTETFLFAQDITRTDGALAHKTIFRREIFASTTPHMPKDPSKPPEALRVVNSRGEALPVDRHYNDRHTGYKLAPALHAWDNAYVNHYAVKSADLTALKLRRGDANGRVAHHRKPGTRQFEDFNRNSVIDPSILTSRSARIAIINRMLAIPEILEAHLACLNWFFDQKRALAQEGVPRSMQSGA